MYSRATQLTVIYKYKWKSAYEGDCGNFIQDEYSGMMSWIHNTAVHKYARGTILISSDFSTRSLENTVEVLEQELAQILELARSTTGTKARWTAEVK